MDMIRELKKVDISIGTQKCLSVVKCVKKGINKCMIKSDNKTEY